MQRGCESKYREGVTFKTTLDNKSSQDRNRDGRHL